MAEGEEPSIEKEAYVQSQVERAFSEFDIDTRRLTELEVQEKEAVFGKDRVQEAGDPEKKPDPKTTIELVELAEDLCKDPDTKVIDFGPGDVSDGTDRLVRRVRWLPKAPESRSGHPHDYRNNIIIFYDEYQIPEDIGRGRSPLISLQNIHWRQLGDGDEVTESLEVNRSYQPYVTRHVRLRRQGRLEQVKASKPATQGEVQSAIAEIQAAKNAAGPASR